MIVRPTQDDRVEFAYQRLLAHGPAGPDYRPDLFQKRFHVLFRRRDSELAADLAKVVPEEVEPLGDMRDTGLLRRELKPPFSEEPFDQGSDFILQPLFRVAGDDEVIRLKPFKTLPRQDRFSRRIVELICGTGNRTAP